MKKIIYKQVRLKLNRETIRHIKEMAQKELAGVQGYSPGTGDECSLLEACPKPH